MEFVEIERRGDVVWVFLNGFSKVLAASEPPTTDVHEGLGRAMHDARYDADVRLVVLTGRQDGEFYTVPDADHYQVQEHRDRVNPLKREFIGGPPERYPDAIESILLMDKPVVARVNGDAIGFGQSVLWACDIILAREDAVISDVHTGQGEVVDSGGVRRGFPQALTPGDGAMSSFPLFVPPTKLKEYMFLSTTFTARELAAMNVVNHAVPMSELDAVVDDIVSRLLARPARVLAGTKRVCNKNLVEQMIRARDLANAYEINDLWNHAKDGSM
jgi:enoyl-CoA hydratase